MCLTGKWLPVMPSIQNHTFLSAQEWRDGLFLRFGQTPHQLPATCDGCHAPFSVLHGLECPNGGLIIRRHNTVRDTLGSIAAENYGSSAVRSEPQLSTTSAPTLAPGHPMLTTPHPIADPHTPPPPPVLEENLKGDLSIEGFIESCTTSIIDVSIVSLDSKSYRDKKPLSALQGREKAKLRKYQAACESRRETFHPFIASADGMLAPEANAIIDRLATHMHERTQRPLSQTTNFVRIRIAFALVKATHRCLRASHKLNYPSRAPQSYAPPDPAEPPPEFRFHFPS